MNGTRDIVFKRCGCTDAGTGRQLAGPARQRRNSHSQVLQRSQRIQGQRYRLELAGRREQCRLDVFFAGQRADQRLGIGERTYLCTSGAKQRP